MPLNDRDIIITIKTIKTMMNLEKLGISSEDVLQRSQLASIFGGNDQDEDYIDCNTNNHNTCTFECPCPDSRDWCKNGKCELRGSSN